MFTIPELAADALGSHLAAEMGHRFGSTEAGLIERVQSAARLAIDCIGGSDALYHNVEHTMLVTLVGLDILRGRQLLVETSASDFEHLIVACLFHDIGYVRGILKGDSADGYIIDAKANKVELPRGSSDAALMPYRVDRSKLFVMDRVAKSNRSTPSVSLMPSNARVMAPPTATVKRALWYVPPISSASSATRNICAKPMRFIASSRKSEGINNSATPLRPILPIYIQSFIGAAYRRISRAPCATSTSRRTDGGGLPIYTAISFAPSASQASPAHNGKAKPRMAQSPKTSMKTCCT